MTRAMASRMAVVAALGAALVAGTARGQPKNASKPNDRSKAAELAFQEGEKLIRAGKIAEGCAKLEESDRLERGFGVLFNLADCHERIGPTASAWSEFRDAEAIAVGNHQADRQQKADRRAAALEPKLARLRVTVAGAATGVSVTRDGQPLDAALLGKPVPVDPGEHELAATAPGRVAWSRRVNVSEAGGTVELAIPALDAAPYAVAVDGPSSGGLGAQRIAGIVVAVLGAAGLGAGIGTAVAANGKWHRALDEHCNAAAQCDAAGRSLGDEALGLAHASTATFIVGSLAGATAIVLLVTAPKSTAPRVGLSAGRVTIAVDFE